MCRGGTHTQGGREMYEEIISIKLICMDYFSLQLVDLVTRHVQGD